MPRKSLFAYLGTLLAFLVLDGLWLGVLMGPTYKSLLGPLMLEQPRLLPAMLFYLLYVLGCVVLVILPSGTCPAALGRARRAWGLCSVWWPTARMT